MPRTIIGTVSSTKSNKTIVVSVSRRKTHPLYRKQYTVNSKFMAHDEKNEAKLGDTVQITECRPISAKKRFILSQIIERPALSEEHLAAVKSDDSGQKASKSKTEEDETEEKP